LELVPEANLQNYKCIKRDHASKFPRLSRTHLHVGWTALPVLIAVIGAIMVARQITC
jgi:hypothetical protein